LFVNRSGLAIVNGKELLMYIGNCN